MAVAIAVLWGWKLRSTRCFKVVSVMSLLLLSKY